MGTVGGWGRYLMVNGVMVVAMVGVGILRPARNAVVIVALATGKNPAPIAGCDITVAKVPEVIKQPPR